MGRTKIIYIDEEDLPPRCFFGKPQKRSWMPWAAVEQIPQGMALEVTPWLNGREPRNAGSGLQGPGSRLTRRYPYLRVMIRGPALFIWYPSQQVQEDLNA